MVNYSKSIIYKLCCKDPLIKEEYIGSTTNKNRRKSQHKCYYNKENDIKYNYPVYKFIRENGGFDNWDMIIIEEYPCENKNQLEVRERYWIEERKPKLNKQVPTRTHQEYNRNDEVILKQSLYRKEYSKTDKRKQYVKIYNKSNLRKEVCKRYRENKKLKNKSAIIIQNFYRNYIKKNTNESDP